MFDRIHRRKHRNRKKVPRDLPPTVRFDVIDYEGERLYLAAPIEADASLDEEGDVLLLNDEAFVYGIGPTLEDAMEDFCGSFLLCYKAQFKYGPGAIGDGILRYAGDNTIQKTRRSFPQHFRVSHDVLMFRISPSTIPRPTVNNGPPYRIA